MVSLKSVLMWKSCMWIGVYANVSYIESKCIKYLPVYACGLVCLCMSEHSALGRLEYVCVLVCVFASVCFLWGFLSFVPV